MKKTAIALLIALCCVLLGGVICFGGLVKEGFNFSRLDPTEYAAEEYAFEGAIDEVDLELFAEDAQILPAEDGVCRVKVLEEKEYPHVVALAGGRLTVKGSQGRRPWYKNLLLIRLKSQKVALYLPAGAYQRLFASASAGDVKVEGDFSFDTAQLDVATGDVIWKDAFAKELEITAATGDVLVANCRPETLHIAAATGDVTLREMIAQKEVRCQVSTGDILLTHADGGNLFLKATTGDIMGSILTPKTFAAETTTGDITVPATQGEGVCRAETTTGDVNLWLEGDE